jgi:hypothetical protein
MNEQATVEPRIVWAETAGIVSRSVTLHGWLHG